MPKQVRDQKGKFVNGHPPCYHPPKRGTVDIVPHPDFPGKDTHGRIMPGYSGRMSELRMAFMDAVQGSQTPEQVIEVMNELRSLAMTCPNHYVKLAALQEFLNRMIGRTPTQREVTIDKTETKTTTTEVRIDYRKISDQELEQLETILLKAQPATFDVEDILRLEDKGPTVGE